MLRNQDLADELDQLSKAAQALGRRVQTGGELPGRQLAAATVQAVDLSKRLGRLAARLASCARAPV
jgi:hypothetical protein